jgi:hypothetical protein
MRLYAPKETKCRTWGLMVIWKLQSNIPQMMARQRQGDIEKERGAPGPMPATLENVATSYVKICQTRAMKMKIEKLQKRQGDLVGIKLRLLVSLYSCLPQDRTWFFPNKRHLHSFDEGIATDRN